MRRAGDRTQSSDGFLRGHSQIQKTTCHDSRKYWLMQEFESFEYLVEVESKLYDFVYNKTPLLEYPCTSVVL